jgi:hypothetical protein
VYFNDDIPEDDDCVDNSSFEERSVRIPRLADIIGPRRLETSVFTLRAHNFEISKSDFVQIAEIVVEVSFVLLT